MMKDNAIMEGDGDEPDWKEQLKRLLSLSWANILTYLVQLTIPVLLHAYMMTEFELTCRGK